VENDTSSNYTLVQEVLSEPQFLSIVKHIHDTKVSNLSLLCIQVEDSTSHLFGKLVTDLHNTHVTKLALVGNHLRDAFLVHYIQGLVHVTDLNLSYNEFTSRGWRALMCALPKSKIEALTWSGYSTWTMSDMRAFSRRASKCKLRVLRMQQCTWTLDTWTYFCTVVLPKLKNTLSRLDVSRSRFPDDFAKIFAERALPHLVNLRHLDWNGNDCSSSILNGIRLTTSLRRVALEIHIVHNSMYHLLESDHLTELDLVDCVGSVALSDWIGSIIQQKRWVALRVKRCNFGSAEAILHGIQNSTSLQLVEWEHATDHVEPFSTDVWFNAIRAHASLRCLRLAPWKEEHARLGSHLKRLRSTELKSLMVILHHRATGKDLLSTVPTELWRVLYEFML